MKLLTYSGPLFHFLFIDFFYLFIYSPFSTCSFKQSFIIVALLSCGVLLRGINSTCVPFFFVKPCSNRLNQLNPLIGNVRIDISLSFGDTKQIFLQRMSCEAAAEESGTGGHVFRSRCRPNPSIGVERNNLLSSLFILSLMWNFTRATGPPVNLLLVWVCPQEARWLRNFESPSGETRPESCEGP